MKTRHLHLVLVLPLALGAAACRKEAGPGDPGASREVPASTAPAASPHAPPGARPGSHEDWCAEHEVAESLCTRCNPSLVAAFKATKDWCAEHGLPESQCRTCNPSLKIERPPKEKAR